MAKKRKDDADPQLDSSGGSIAVNDAWTGMLAVSLLALMIGTGFLAWDYISYGDDLKKIPTFTSKMPEKKEPEKAEEKKPN